MKRLMIIFFVALALHTVPGVAEAQDGISRKQQERNLAKKGNEDKKAAARKEKEDHKQHLSIQDKATRKRVKKHTKRANKRGSGKHHDGFLNGLFKRKR